jgi:hypothetical protein
MNKLLDKIVRNPVRHWQGFIKGFVVFMVGVALWYSELALFYIGVDSLGLSDSFMSTYGNSTKIVALVFKFWFVVYCPPKLQSKTHRIGEC